MLTFDYATAYDGKSEILSGTHVSNVGTYPWSRRGFKMTLLVVYIFIIL